MRISDKKKTALYAAIHEPIMKKRITIAQSDNVLGEKNAKDIDAILYKLNQDIWSQVKITLGISDV